MLFRQLEYFVAVAQERHFAPAAERCYVLQPALSAAIAKLERELDVTLINRGHSFVGLTAEGERLVVWAKRILAEHDAFKAEVRAVRSGITGILRLGAVPTASTTASLVLSAFCSDHPLVKVHIHSRLATTELYQRLRDFEMEAAIVHPLPDEVHDVELVPLYEERYVLLAPSDMLPAGTSTLRWPDAAQLPLALLTSDMRDRCPAGRDRLRRFDVGASRDRPLGLHRPAHLAVDHVDARGHPGIRRSTRRSRHRLPSPPTLPGRDHWWPRPFRQALRN